MTQQIFDQIFDRVKSTDIWKTMASTVENSPWHREESVAVHTEMVLAEYEKNFAPIRNERQQLITKLALLYHDFGKPEAEETLHREDGSDYRRYAGHELLSANNFVDFITTHNDLRRLLYEAKIASTDLRAIRFMVEHHLPYDMNDDKLSLLKMNLIELLGDNWFIFTDMVISDCLGRISDDHPAKIAKSNEWVQKFKDLEPATKAVVKDSAPTMFVLIGTTGSGKSTFIKSVGDIPTFSMDKVRIDMYVEDVYPHSSKAEVIAKETEAAIYEKAFNYAFANQAAFDLRVKQDFNNHIKAKQDFVLDNMNTSKKARRSFITHARQSGYKIVSVEFWLPLQTAIDRQHTRGDKNVPAKVVVGSYMRNQLPMLAASYNRNGRPTDVVGSEIDEFKIIYSY